MVVLSCCSGDCSTQEDTLSMSLKFRQVNSHFVWDVCVCVLCVSV